MPPPVRSAEIDLVDIIDFKWLMAHEGHKVHVERMQGDRGYAKQCLETAAASSSAALRRAGCRLESLLGLN